MSRASERRGGRLDRRADVYQALHEAHPPPERQRLGRAEAAMALAAVACLLAGMIAGEVDDGTARVLAGLEVRTPEAAYAGAFLWWPGLLALLYASALQELLGVGSAWCLLRQAVSRSLVLAVVFLFGSSFAVTPTGKPGNRSSDVAREIAPVIGDPQIARAYVDGAASSSFAALLTVSVGGLALAYVLEKVAAGSARRAAIVALVALVAFWFCVMYVAGAPD